MHADAHSAAAATVPAPPGRRQHRHRRAVRQEQRRLERERTLIWRLLCVCIGCQLAAPDARSARLFHMEPRAGPAVASHRTIARTPRAVCPILAFTILAIKDFAEHYIAYL